MEIPKHITEPTENELTPISVKLPQDWIPKIDRIANQSPQRFKAGRSDVIRAALSMFLADNEIPICPSCKTINPQEAVFCMTCGTKIHQ